LLQKLIREIKVNKTLWLGRAKSLEKAEHIPVVGAGEMTCGRRE